MKRIALVTLITLIALAAITLFASKTNYSFQDRDHIAETASHNHLLGTDDLGRDRAVRLAGAALLGLAGATCASALATLLALAVGTTAAFTHKTFASILIYISDLFLILPWLFLLMIVRSALPLTIQPLTSALVTFLMLGLLGWAAYARITFAGVMAVKNSEWMTYGRAMGLRKRQLIWRYLIPHLLPLTLSQFLLMIPVFLIAEANLGALGLGISEPLPSYGSMLLALQHPAVLAGTHWSFAPIVLLIIILCTLELLVIEV